MTTPGVDPSELASIVDSKLKRFRTKSLDISFNELLGMYNEGELKINPDFQRMFRWSEGQQSRFIESLALEMPIPPIFVIEIDDGKYELIDGLQRISSYLHFRGVLSAPDIPDAPIHPGNFLTLCDCDIVSELNGNTWQDIPAALQIRIKRYFVRVEVVRKESDNKFKYHMFKRLNTGGEKLSEQEIRNCTVRLLSDVFIKYVIELAGQPDFKACIANISDEAWKSKYDEELVLRFFAFKNNRAAYEHDVGDFMTEYMETVSDPESGAPRFDYRQEREIFEKTFRILNKCFQDRAFGRAVDLLPKN
jgi:uncharacterized protein with ParB-like and HNH nuclease domain